MTTAHQIHRENSLYYMHARLARRRVSHCGTRGLRSALLICLAACFLVAALSQTLELRHLTMEYKAISADIQLISQTTAAIAEQCDAGEKDNAATVAGNKA